MITEIEIDLGPVNVYVEVDYDVTPVSRATFYHPAEGGEVEINDYRILVVSGDNWEKSYGDLGDWAPIIDRAVDKQFDRLVDLEDLYETWSNS